MSDTAGPSPPARRAPPAPGAAAARAVRPLPGPVRFAHFAYPPNALGYCGPDDAVALRDAAQGGDLPLVRALARGFEGAFPYLELIAACNGIADPLDGRVVAAYWLGNALLERVPAALLARSLEDRFGRRAGRTLPAIAEAALARGASAHHSFHVLGVYPFLGLLRAGRADPALEVLERCRVRWGRVVSLDGGLAAVRSRPLVVEAGRLALGAARLEEARHHATSALAPGDVVALHWDWVCERLSPAGLWNLRRWSAGNLAAVNAAAPLAGA